MVVDCDQDGVTSAAMFYNYVKLIAPDTSIQWMMHSGKQHGIEMNRVPTDVQLVVVPDAGSNQYAEHRALKELGYDILILDHHLCDRVSTDAIVINNQLGSYPNRDLSGAGVVYKFLSYYDQKYGYDYADSFLDLAAVGIIGDVMSLDNLETRWIVKNGLARLTNFGLRRFAQKQAFSLNSVTSLTPTDVSFYITPLVNAVIRVGTMEEKETLFRAFISSAKDTEQSTKRGAKPGDLEIIADKAARIATNAKTHQNKMKDASYAMLEGKIEKEGLAENKILVIALDSQESMYVNPNLTGLIAMKLCQEYHRPTLLMRLADDNVYKGSFRVNANSPITNFRDFCASSGLVEYAEGHEQAAGVGIAANNIDTFISYSNQKLRKINITDKVFYADFLVQPSQIYRLEQMCIDLDQIKDIYGKGIEEPKIIVENVPLDTFTLMGKEHDSTKIERDGVAFVKFKDTDFAKKVSSGAYTKGTFLGKLNLNEFMGRVTPQLIIEDYELSSNRFVF